VPTVTPVPTFTQLPTPTPTTSPTNLCRPLCKYSSAGLYEQVHHVMHQLEYDTNRTVIEFALEIKILILEKNMNLASAADEEFAALASSHAATAARYEAALASIGLSPAREDEMDLVEEMEVAAASKQRSALVEKDSASAPFFDAVTSTLLMAADNGEASAEGGGAGGDAANPGAADRKRTVSYAALGAALLCLFSAGAVLEKGRAALSSRPV